MARVVAESLRCMGTNSLSVVEGKAIDATYNWCTAQSGYEQCLQDERIRFVDLNRDELVLTSLRARYAELTTIH